MPILYDYPRAPSPRRARILLAEKGIAHETKIVDLAAGEHQSDAYRAVNPGLTVPALVLEDGTVLTDNAGIAAWAEAFKADPPLFGTTPVDKAEIASWNSKAEGECLMAIAEAMRNTAPAMKDRALPGPVNYAQIPELAERGCCTSSTSLMPTWLAATTWPPAAFRLPTSPAASRLTFRGCCGSIRARGGPMSPPGVPGWPPGQAGACSAR